MRFIQNNLQPYLIKNYSSKPVNEIRTTVSHPNLLNELKEIANDKEYQNILKLLEAYLVGIITEGPILRTEMEGLSQNIELEIRRLE